MCVLCACLHLSIGCVVFLAFCCVVRLLSCDFSISRVHFDSCELLRVCASLIISYFSISGCDCERCGGKRQWLPLVARWVCVDVCCVLWVRLFDLLVDLCWIVNCWSRACSACNDSCGFNFQYDWMDSHVLTLVVCYLWIRPATGAAAEMSTERCRACCDAVRGGMCVLCVVVLSCDVGDFIMFGGSVVRVGCCALFWCDLCNWCEPLFKIGWCVCVCTNFKQWLSPIP